MDLLVGCTSPAFTPNCVRRLLSKLTTYSVFSFVLLAPRSILPSVLGLSAATERPLLGPRVLQRVLGVPLGQRQKVRVPDRLRLAS